ncbi:MAG: M28 family peptidase [Candidatus Sericytochromatia bacterium]|nr:M28 family peptidase [Candidatus Sericytochromatia bacterium]
MRFVRGLSVAMGLIVAGCAVATVSPVQPGAPRSATLASLQQGRNVETQVDIQRLKDTLAVLSGKTAMASGQTIPERGTVNGRELTRQFITGTLEASGYTVERHKYRTNGENLMVRLPATTPTDEWIVVGAHMDSVKNAGANDNGTGTVSVLEIARLMRQVENRKVNVLFAWFDEEELGLIGSEYMAAAFKKQGMKISSVHTIDMMGWDADKDRAVEIERPDGVLWDYYQMVNKTHGLNLKLARTDSGSTDHVAFRAAGFPSVGLCEEWEGGDTTPHYHKKTDTWETVDFAYLASTTKLFTAAVSDLARKVPAPPATKFVPHNKFPGRDHTCGPNHDNHAH